MSHANVFHCNRTITTNLSSYSLVYCQISRSKFQPVALGVVLHKGNSIVSLAECFADTTIGSTFHTSIRWCNCHASKSHSLVGKSRAFCQQNEKVFNFPQAILPFPHSTTKVLALCRSPHQSFYHFDSLTLAGCRTFLNWGVAETVTSQHWVPFTLFWVTDGSIPST